jgi:hypothetical protein
VLLKLGGRRVNTLKRYAGLLIPIFSTKRASNKFEIKKSEKL